MFAFFKKNKETTAKQKNTKLFNCFQVTGYSMQPYLQPGDLVVTSPLKNIVKPGSIIAYWRDKEGITVIHRVVEVKNNFCLTKGDALIETDPDPVYFEQVIGKLLLIIPTSKALTAIGSLFSDNKKLE